MLVPQRNYQSPAYRYGFQGQEKDDEIKGFGNSLNYKFRMHDPRVGRFFAVDPLINSYPFYSPYQFSGNRVLDKVELEGLEVGTPPLLRPWMSGLSGEMTISLPRIVLPRIPVMPRIPPIALPYSPEHNIPQPITPTLPNLRAEDFDWEGIDMGDTSTWPDVPPLEGQGELTEVEPQRQKAIKLGQKRLKDEKGRIYRPHKPDKDHPKGHWDIKDPGKFGQWRNYTPKGIEIPKGFRWGIDWEVPTVDLLNIQEKKLTNALNTMQKTSNKSLKNMIKYYKFKKKVKKYKQDLKKYKKAISKLTI